MDNKVCIACKLLDDCEQQYGAARPPCAAEGSCTQPTAPNSDYAAALNEALVEFDGQVLDSWTRARIRDIVLRLAQPTPGTTLTLQSAMDSYKCSICGHSEFEAK